MCLAVAGKVVSVSDGEGEVLVDGVSRRVSFVALPDAAAGDFVLVSMGLAVEKITEQEASQISEAWDEISQIEVAGD